MFVLRSALLEDLQKRVLAELEIIEHLPNSGLSEYTELKLKREAKWRIEVLQHLIEDYKRKE